MKKRSSSRDAFFYLRVVSGIVFTGIGVLLALLAFGAFTKTSAQTRGQSQAASARPEIIKMVGPVSQGDLRDLPYIAPKEEFEERTLTRHPHPGTGNEEAAPVANCPSFGQTMLDNIMRPAPTIPGPMLNFDGVAETVSGCGCEPPD